MANLIEDFRTRLQITEMQQPTKKPRLEHNYSDWAWKQIRELKKHRETIQNHGWNKENEHEGYDMRDGDEEDEDPYQEEHERVAQEVIDEIVRDNGYDFLRDLQNTIEGKEVDTYWEEQEEWVETMKDQWDDI